MQVLQKPNQPVLIENIALACLNNVSATCNECNVHCKRKWKLKLK